MYKKTNSVALTCGILISLLVLTALAPPFPKVFLIGDSISVHYGPYLVQYTDDIVELSRKQDDGNTLKDLDVPRGANGGDSRMVLEYLRSRTADSSFRPDYMLINCGLHDIKVNPQSQRLQVSPSDYQENLEKIFQLLKQNRIQPIWITTTPVNDSIHNKRSGSFKRFSEHLTSYNQIAAAVCRKHEIPAIDLHRFSKKLGVDQFSDHVHYKEPARALQAAYITGQLTQILRNSQDRGK